MNVLFDYMYRDFGNWKMGGEVVFANPDGLVLDATEQRLRHACCENDNFNARQAGVPEVYFETTDIEFDQVYHELCALQATTKATTDARTLRQFVEEFEAAAARGWELTPQVDSMGYPLPVGRRVVESTPPAAPPAVQQAGASATQRAARGGRSRSAASPAPGSSAAASRKKRPRAKS
jgi:hypothetical protein